MRLRKGIMLICLTLFYISNAEHKWSTKEIQEELKSTVVNIINECENLLPTSNVAPDCSIKKIKKILKSSVNIIVKELGKSTQHIENEISENDKKIYSNFLTGIQNSTLQVIDAQSFEIMILKTIINETNSRILAEMRNSTADTVEAQSTAIRTLKKVVIESNDILAEIRNNTADTLDAQSTEIRTLHEVINESNDILVEIRNSTADTLDAQSTDIRLLTEIINQSNEILAEIRKNNTDTPDAQSIEIRSLMEAINKSNGKIDSLSSDISILKESLAKKDDIICQQKIAVLLETTEGLTSYDGRTVILPTAFGATETFTWEASVGRCSELGAIPFLPKSMEDFRFMQQLRSDTGKMAVWFPAHDLETEGNITWFDGSEAIPLLKLVDHWYHSSNSYPGDNSDHVDCMNFWGNSLEFQPCSVPYFPMICEII